MFTVTGSDEDGVPYAVTVADTPDDTGHVATGSPHVRSLLDALDGDTVDVTPTGPSYQVAIGDPESVLAALYAATTVAAVDGDAPQVIPPEQIGVVY